MGRLDFFRNGSEIFSALSLRRSGSLALVLAVALVTGCQSYEYHVVQPASAAGRVGESTRIIPLPPVEYRLVEDAHRLVIQVVNPQDSAINVLGPKSYLVDPRGLTHPLESRTIAPRSYINLVIPPAPNIVYTPPSLAVGLGFGRPYGPYPYNYYRSTIFYDDFFYPPSGQFHYIYPDHYWEWREGDVRMHLGYQGTNDITEHDFLFRRQKAERKR